MTENTKNEEYNKKRYEKRKQKYRKELAIDIFKQYPYLNIIWVVLITIIIIANIYLYKTIGKMGVSHYAKQIFRYSAIIVVNVISALLIREAIYKRGNSIAEEDEANIREAFVGYELNDMPPILKSKRKIGKYTYKRIFDTTIPAEDWNERIINLQMCMENKIRKIEGRENSREVTMLSIDGKNVDESKELFDEEL